MEAAQQPRCPDAPAPVARATLGRGLRLALAVLRALVLLLSAMALYAFALQLHR